MLHIDTTRHKSQAVQINTLYGEVAAKRRSQLNQLYTDVGLTNNKNSEGFKNPECIRTYPVRWHYAGESKVE